MSAKTSVDGIRIAADVGGTFTDVAVLDGADGTVSLGKQLTTPARIVDGILNSVRKSDRDCSEADLFLHGSTIAINTLLERSGAKAALVTTAGFRDIYEIGRVNRPDAYNLFFRKHLPLIPRSRRFEVNERMLADGTILRSPCRSEMQALADELAVQGVESVAILFLHSYRNPDNEFLLRDFLKQALPETFVTTSCELSLEYREFERTSTVAANAYVGPRVRSYLREAVDSLKDEGFAGKLMIVQSTGGLYDEAQARNECIKMLESGPAAGVIATRELCLQLGLESAIAFDMGGTTAKAGMVINGSELMCGSAQIGPYAEALPIQIPMIDIQEVGTGGGSVAYVVPGPALRVGPRSAGSVPGPACYDRGGIEPTVTDANLVLGRLSQTSFLGGEMSLNLEAAQRSIASVADQLGLSVIEAADGIIRIAAASMSDVVRRVTTERGIDARDLPLVAYGGAGPLHAAFVAKALRMSRLVIPNHPGHFSAYGMLVADIRRDFVSTKFTRLDHADFDDLAKAYLDLELEGGRDVSSAAAGHEVRFIYGADMRYIGQEHAVEVSFPAALVAAGDGAGIKRAFDGAHMQRYGYAAEKEGAEIVSIRCAAIATLSRPKIASIAHGGANPPMQSLKEQRKVFYGGSHGFTTTSVYDRAGLTKGNVVHGPALIEEHASTTLIAPGDRLEVDAFGNLRIDLNVTGGG